MAAIQEQKYKKHTIVFNGKYFVVDGFKGNFLTIQQAYDFIDNIVNEKP